MKRQDDLASRLWITGKKVVGLGAEILEIQDRIKGTNAPMIRPVNEIRYDHCGPSMSHGQSIRNSLTASDFVPRK